MEQQQKKIMLHLAGITMLGMPFIAYMIDVFSEDLNLRERIFGGQTWWIQIALGLIVVITCSRGFFTSVTTGGAPPSL